MILHINAKLDRLFVVNNSCLPNTLLGRLFNIINKYFLTNIIEKEDIVSSVKKKINLDYF